MSEFNAIYNEVEAKEQPLLNQVTDADIAYAHSLTVSGDGSGSHPEEYLPESITDECMAFLGAAATFEDRYPNADQLYFMKRRNGRLAWDRPDKANVGLVARPFQFTRTYIGQGYRIGSVELKNTTGTSPLMLCTDGLLRCDRTPGIFPSSYGFGYGTLPDPGMMNVKLRGVGKASSYGIRKSDKSNRTHEEARAAAFSADMALFLRRA